VPLALSFAAPLWLLGLLLLPVALLFYVTDQQRRRAQADAFADPRTAPSALGAAPGAGRHVAPLLYALALAALVVALARPQGTVAVPNEQATVVLVTDRSGSMQATDVPPDRITAAREAAFRFLDGLPRRLRAAAVAFNQRAEVIAAPTTDRQELKDAYRQLTPRGGTATGEALATALRIVRPDGRVQPGTRPTPAAIVLLSDGASVRGRDPVDVAREAARLGVPIYAVALGTPGGTIRVPRPGGAQGVEVRRVPPDVASLRRIAALTKGRVYAAESAERLDEVYRELGSKIGTRNERREVTYAAVGAGLLLLLAGGGASLGLFGRLP
jgi:Ca-activated chloride channel family protein